jgi:O-acetyl-ADP-ribose deacetylase
VTVLEAVLGDITRQDTAAIVNAANTALAPGGGVCGAIHRAAGPELARACAALGGCPTGEARITAGFALPARFVIHAVGPVWQGGNRGEAGFLAACYRRSLELVQAEGQPSVAFPCISTGIFGYPAAAAAEVAVTTVRDCVPRLPAIELVRFVCFREDDLAIYRALLEPRA